MKRIRDFMEVKFFGVCSYLGEKLGIRTSHIRMFFVYSTFLTLGSPILVYLAFAFLLNMRNYIRRRRRNPIWDF
ncbi:MAG: PspC domain-containing protein [Bacteroidia bacterium]